MPGKKQLSLLAGANTEAEDLASFVDMNNITIDQDAPIETRMVSYLEQIGNPYCFRCGDIPVRVRFTSENRTLSEALGSYFKRLR